MSIWERVCVCGQVYTPKTAGDGACPTCRYEREPSYRAMIDAEAKERGIQPIEVAYPSPL